MGTLAGEATLPFSICFPSQLKSLLDKQILSFNSIALRKAKIAYNFGLSECNRVKRVGPILEVLCCSGKQTGTGSHENCFPW